MPVLRCLALLLCCSSVSLANYQIQGTHQLQTINNKNVKGKVIAITDSEVRMVDGDGKEVKTPMAQVIAIKQNEKYDEAKVAERLRDHSWFIAFAPVENPKIALAVIVENGGFGARAAAPIARTVLDYFLLGKRQQKGRATKRIA